MALTAHRPARYSYVTVHVHTGPLITLLTSIISARRVTDRDTPNGTLLP